MGLALALGHCRPAQGKSPAYLLGKSWTSGCPLLLCLTSTSLHALHAVSEVGTSWCGMGGQVLDASMCTQSHAPAVLLAVCRSRPVTLIHFDL